MDVILPDTKLDLEARYNEPHRHYHNMNHINLCLLAMNRLRALVSPREINASVFMEVEAMIWFHDAVYEVGPNVRRGDNELASANLWYSSRKSDPLLDFHSGVIYHGILMSAEHTKQVQMVRGSTLSQRIFLDIDLSSLGTPRYGRFVEDGDNIRNEYAWVPDDIFNANRKQFFTKLLARPHLYYNHVMRGLYEENARSNINRWISENT